MSKQESLCLLCRSYMCLQRYVPAGKALPEITCKKGLYKGETMTIIVSCTEFSSRLPGVIIDSIGSGSFHVQATGKWENVLCSSLDDAIQAATDILKQELLKHKEKEEVS